MKKVRMQEAALFLSLMSKSDSRSKRIRYLQNLILHHFRMPFIKRGSPAGSLMQRITEMRAGIWLCGERIRPSPPQPLEQAMPGDGPQSAFAIGELQPSSTFRGAFQTSGGHTARR